MAKEIAPAPTVRPPAVQPIKPPVAPTPSNLPAVPPKMKLGILSPSPSPQKETARVVVVTEKPMKATVKLSTVPPAEIPPAGIVRPPPIKVAGPPPTGLVESVPMPFYWTLLGISALAFLIQLWTYFS